MQRCHGSSHILLTTHTHTHPATVNLVPRVHILQSQGHQHAINYPTRVVMHHAPRGTTEVT